MSARDRLARAAGAVIVLAVLGAAGCETFQVRPWDRDLLARPEMQLDPNPILRGIDDHIYFSKEGSTGGADVGGGGCGCN